MKAADVMEQVVSDLVAMMEAGAGDWAMPWRQMGPPAGPPTLTLATAAAAVTPSCSGWSLPGMASRRAGWRPTSSGPRPGRRSARVSAEPLPIWSQSSSTARAVDDGHGHGATSADVVLDGHRARPYDCHCVIMIDSHNARGGHVINEHCRNRPVHAHQELPVTGHSPRSATRRERARSTCSCPSALTTRPPTSTAGRERCWRRGRGRGCAPSAMAIPSPSAPTGPSSSACPAQRACRTPRSPAAATSSKRTRARVG